MTSKEVEELRKKICAAYVKAAEDELSVRRSSQSDQYSLPTRECVSCKKEFVPIFRDDVISDTCVECDQFQHEHGRPRTWRDLPRMF
jgi:hypothetical protein